MKAQLKKKGEQRCKGYSYISCRHLNKNGKSKLEIELTETAPDKAKTNNENKQKIINKASQALPNCLCQHLWLWIPVKTKRVKKHLQIL